MNPFRADPGPCPICGVAHTACTTDSGPIRVQQLPSREAMDVPTTNPAVAQEEPEVQTFTTKTYRGRKGKR